MLRQFPYRLTTRWVVPTQYFRCTGVVRDFSSTTGQKTSYNVCIVGSGPSGFYTAKYLLRDDPDVQVDVLDMLPTPFGKCECMYYTGILPLVNVLHAFFLQLVMVMLPFLISFSVMRSSRLGKKRCCSRPSRSKECNQ